MYQLINCTFWILMDILHYSSGYKLYIKIVLVTATINIVTVL